MATAAVLSLPTGTATKGIRTVIAGNGSRTVALDIVGGTAEYLSTGGADFALPDHLEAPIRTSARVIGQATSLTPAHNPTTNITNNADDATQAAARQADGLVDDFVQSTPSSRRLGANMEAAGMQRPPDSAAHHIVAGRAKPARRSLAILSEFEIDINDAGNGVFLPLHSKVPNPTGAVVDAPLHTGIYYTTVQESLLEATTRGEALGILDRIRSRLLSGDYP